MVQNTNCQIMTSEKADLASENKKMFSHEFNAGSKTLKYEKLKCFHDDNLCQTLT